MVWAPPRLEDVTTSFACPVEGGSPRARIRRALELRVARRWPFTDGDRAEIVLDAGAAGCFTLFARQGRVVIAEGRAPRPTAIVRADPQAMIELLEGRSSGVDIWLDGRLSVRGSLALAMKLEGLLEDARRPRHFPRPRRVQAHGVSTFFLEAGKGSPVVLLHGLGATNASMLPTLRDLARDHRVIAPDLPGFGESSKPLRRYHAGFFARWLVALLDRLGIEKAHLVGNSMGGRIAIEAGLLAPDRVQRLALLAPAVAFRKFRQLVPIVRLLRPELGVLPMIFPRATVLSTLRMLFADCKRLPLAWYEAAADEFLRVAATPRGRVCLFSAAQQIYLDDPWGKRGFWPRLARLERPALFVWGDRDLLVPVKFCHHVSRTLPHAECVILPDCGHVPQFEHPERTHALVRGFLGSH
jgi:pimeloyl-ACP methyl ester carboxylesterase